MANLDLKTETISQLASEFLRRIANEMNGRKFEYIEDPINEGQSRDFVTAHVKAEDFLKVLPELTREFAAKIRPEFTRCHKLAPLPMGFNGYSVRDPIGGIEVRCLRHWDVMQSEMIYRFDAAFS